MIQLDIWNTQLWSVSQEKVEQIISTLTTKRDNLGFIDVEKYVDIQKIQDFVNDVRDDFDSIVILWIGGSALWTKALLESLYGKYYNEQKNKKWKNIYVLDNIDADAIADTLQVVNIRRTLFCFISKSGSTIETLSEYLFFREQVQCVTADWKKHFCFIVGKNCTMRKKLEEDFQCFYIPENIGGRFSVFTAVWLLPLAFSGVNISGFLEGIAESRENFLSSDIQKNTALKTSRNLKRTSMIF